MTAGRLEIADASSWPGSWERATFEELLRAGDLLVIQDGNHGSKYPKAEEFGPIGLPLITGAEMASGRIDLTGAKRLNHKTAESLTKGRAKAGDVLLTHKGSIGKTAIVPPDHCGEIILNPQITLYRVAENGRIDRQFLKYFFDTRIFQDFLTRVTGISTIPTIGLKAQKSVEFVFPDRNEQREIAAVLGALDDKIELNRKTAATLEEMARALYRSWFIDFDPVHAKAQGRAPAHMDPATAALFPDSFGEDGLPEGWDIGSLVDAFDIVMGQSPPGDTYNENGNGLPFYQGRTDFGFRFPKIRKYCSAPSRMAPRDSILLSVRAPVGDLNRAWEQCCIGRGVASLAEKSGRNAYGYEAMWALSDALKAYDNEGTVFGSINKKQLSSLELVLSPNELRDAFEDIVRPIDEQVRNITAENQTLATLRDTLLPRLMSGELRVGEAKEELDAVS
ncbi:hypothetical protein BVC71_09475 [Marivivens niveibacter]|uniref:Type I restriction modification DNA specificity domain-containing protein n=1 Tax=Marivivens niveibacter TaxID=1930667 RepID=A0A251WXU4_9RHOB|nr:restriction endonuclease subunit S [Marivivens niveibacter]OUD08938.1 hypothetical protein BVC71_09475 [Marivivens niveibacter]